ncbi:AAA ATPase-like protein [Aureococcus anophagefferens]|nr:AAA ATPase-like protein [Aureococcus anophagefferens]
MNAFLSSMTGSKPKKSALESAVAKLKEGKRLDELKQFKAALALYEDGLATLLGCLKQERDAAKKPSWLKSSRSIWRAEQLKASLGARAPDHHAYGARTPVARAPSPHEAQILAEMLDASPGVGWSDVKGLEGAKRTLKEAVVLPYLRPDLYKGLRSPPKGVLLFGPPGTGKTLLAECVASESRFAFFALSASALTSKWLGEGEKLVKALFKVARDRAPSVVFLDEVDSLLSRRGDGDHEASRRLKTEFLVHLDGLGGGGRVLFMGATNRPWDLDDAFLRRVPRRVLIPLPDGAARRAFLDALLDGEDGARTSLDAARREKVVAATEGYSMSDLRALAEEAAMGPLRALGDRVATARARDVRPVSLADFDAARRAIKPAADAALLARYDDWASQFGTRGN